MTDIYSSPERFGLETFGEIQWGEPCYSFDLTVVWRRPADGTFFYCEDSGCSCPSPFEDKGVADLIPIETLAGFQSHLNALGGESQPDDIARLLERMHEAGVR